MGGNASWCGHSGHQYGGPSKNLEIHLPYDPVVALLGICPKQMKTDEKGHTHPMFMAALSTTAKLRKQPECPSEGERIKRMCLCVRRTVPGPSDEEGELPACDGVDGPEGTRRKMSGTDKFHMISLKWALEKTKQTQSRLLGSESILVVAGGGWGDLGRGWRHADAQVRSKHSTDTQPVVPRELGGRAHRGGRFAVCSYLVTTLHV